MQFGVENPAGKVKGARRGGPGSLMKPSQGGEGGEGGQHNGTRNEPTNAIWCWKPDERLGRRVRKRAWFSQEARPRWRGGSGEKAGPWYLHGARRRRGGTFHDVSSDVQVPKSETIRLLSYYSRNKTSAPKVQTRRRHKKKRIVDNFLNEPRLGPTSLAHDSRERFEIIGRGVSLDAAATGRGS